MVHGHATGRTVLADPDTRLPEHHRLDAVRAYLEGIKAGDVKAAIFHYLRAAGRTTSVAERDHLIARATSCTLLRSHRPIGWDQAMIGYFHVRRTVRDA